METHEEHNISGIALFILLAVPLYIASLHPSLHNNAIYQPSTLNSCTIIIKDTIWECGANCVRASEIFRARSSGNTLF